jgi:aminoglycoside 3-N-acetyltransferase
MGDKVGADSRTDSSRKVLPDELSAGFRDIGLREGDSVMLHASLDSFGTVDGGAAMVLHRLLGVLGRKGTLLMPTFTAITRHSATHDNYTRPGCWCEGKETRHVPFIPELQPDKAIGPIAHRLCSWPSSRRSKHPAYSFVAVGKHGDDLVREHELLDPLSPVRRFLKQKPKVVTAGVGLDSVTSIHLAEEKKVARKFVKERALTVTSQGQVWLEVVALGCSAGFGKLESHLDQKDINETKIGLAVVRSYPMESLVETAESLLAKNVRSLTCNNTECLSCCVAGN